MLEREVMQGVDKRLSVWACTGDIVFHLRTNSGHVKTKFDSYIKLAPKGTPDFIVVVRNKEQGLDLLFIEVKRSDGKGKLSPDQVKFKNKYKEVDNTHYLVIDHPDYVDFYITDICYDRTQEISI